MAFHQPPPPPFNERAELKAIRSSIEYQNLIRRRTNVEFDFEVIEQLMEMYKPTGDSLEGLKLRKESVIDIKRKFDEIQSELLNLFPYPEIPVDLRAVSIQFGLDFHRLLTSINENLALKSFVIETPPSPVSRLPQMPVFDGHYSNWLIFKQDFKSLIINNDDFSNVDKLLYLLAHLNGNAKAMFKFEPITDDNFPKAWRELCEKYDNNRHLLENFIESLINASPMPRDSAYELKFLLDTYNNIFQSLRLLNQPIEHWGILMVYLMASKLSPDTLKAWKDTLDFNEVPTWDKFEAYLTHRIRNLQTKEAQITLAGSSIGFHDF